MSITYLPDCNWKTTTDQWRVEKKTEVITFRLNGSVSGNVTRRDYLRRHIHTIVKARPVTADSTFDAQPSEPYLVDANMDQPYGEAGAKLLQMTYEYPTPWEEDPDA